MKRLAASLACLVLLGACATGAGGPGPPPVGASEVEIEQGRYQVIFRGASGTPADEVQDRALMRAAELSLTRGYDWFRVVNRSMSMAPPTSPRVSFGIGTATYGRRSAFGLGASTARGGEGTFVAILEIVGGRGPRPPGADVYGARSVSDTLRARLR